MIIPSMKSCCPTEAELLPGDHLCVKRKGRFYTHHGIYLGNGRVIHVSGSLREKIDPEVRETDLPGFLKGGPLKRREHKKRRPAAETTRIAEQRLADKEYSMLWNNCEHFATYCATGKRKSSQVRRAVSGLGTLAGGVAVVILGRTMSFIWRRY